MSDSFFHFSVQCPKCNYVSNEADGFETDDWTEVFVSSGYSIKSAKPNMYHEYICPNCKEITDIDKLYSEKCITVESIDSIKSYLIRMLEYVLEKEGIYDHGWDPDIETAVRRLLGM